MADQTIDEARELRLARKRAAYAANADARRAAAKVYRLANPEKVRAGAIAWREANREKTRIDARKSYHANRERNLEAMRKWREANPGYHKAKALEAYHADPETKKAAWRVRRSANPEIERARVSQWFKDNPEKVRALANRRRARVAGATIGEVCEREVFERDGWRCYICDGPVVLVAAKNAPNKAEIEHVVPISRGGAHSMDNLRCSCRRCNTLKGAHRTPEQVRALIGGPLVDSDARLGEPDTDGQVACP